MVKKFLKDMYNEFSTSASKILFLIQCKDQRGKEKRKREGEQGTKQFGKSKNGYFDYQFQALFPSNSGKSSL